MFQPLQGHFQVLAKSKKNLKNSQKINIIIVLKKLIRM